MCESYAVCASMAISQHHSFQSGRDRRDVYIIAMITITSQSGLRIHLFWVGLFFYKHSSQIMFAMQHTNVSEIQLQPAAMWIKKTQMEL